MANTLFPGMPNPGGPLGNFQNMMQQFQQFKASFQGDPKAEVQRLMSTGQMTQQQYDQLSQAAQMFQNLIGK